MFCQSCGKELAEGTNFCSFCGSEILNVNGTKLNNMDIQRTIDYLKHVYVLEELRYKENKAIEKMKVLVIDKQRETKLSMKQLASDNKQFIKELSDFWSAILLICAFIILPFVYGYLYVLMLFVMNIPSKIAGIISFLILASIVGFIVFKYKQRKKAKANEKMRSFNENISSYNKNIKDKNMLIIGAYKDEMRIIENNISVTERNLNNAYSIDILYRNYQRDFIAIASFIEYLESGRCTSLPAAYNKYEEEKRAGIIIDKLTNIESKLDTIIRNQETIINSINKSREENRQMILSLKESVNRNTDSLYKLENCAEAIEYNAKGAYLNTEFQKWYTVFNDA